MLNKLRCLWKHDWTAAPFEWPGRIYSVCKRPGCGATTKGKR